MSGDQFSRLKQLEKENERLRRGCRPDAVQADPGGGGPGGSLNLSERRHCIERIHSRLGGSERRSCRMVGQHSSTQRHVPRGRGDEEHLVADMTEVARRYGRYGYQRIAALLRQAGWEVNDKGDERLRRREVLKMPVCQP